MVIVSNLIGAVAPNFALFLVGRLILGWAVGGLWTFAIAIGRRLMPESPGARAKPYPRFRGSLENLAFIRSRWVDLLGLAVRWNSAVR